MLVSQCRKKKHIFDKKKKKSSSKRFMISKKKFTTNTKVIVIWETFVGKRVQETNQNNIKLEHETKKKKQTDWDCVW